MNNGKLVIGVVMVGVVIGGMWMRVTASSEWGLTRAWYHGKVPVFQRCEALHHQVRDLQAHPERPADRVIKEAQAIEGLLAKEQAPNGRTIMTRDAAYTYAVEVDGWAQAVARTHAPVSETASPSYMDVEEAFGALVGQVNMDNREYQFKLAPAPGTMPTPSPRRVI